MPQENADLQRLGSDMRLWLLGCALAHVAAFPCESEIAAACPDSPRSELVQCLKDPSQHEQVTEISSECTDFMGLNSTMAVRRPLSTDPIEALVPTRSRSCAMKPSLARRRRRA